MFVKKLTHCHEFTANDGCLIRELLHPSNDPVELPYSLAYAKITAHHHSYRHRLEQAEVYYILSGQGRMFVDEESKDVCEGDIVWIPPGSLQYLENRTSNDLCFLALVSPPWTEEDDIRITD